MQNLSFSEEFLSKVPEQLKEEVISILDKVDLNWDVKKEDLVSISGSETPNAGIFRTDFSFQEPKDTWLGTTSKKYTPYQNSELVLTIHVAGKAVDLKIIGGGSNYEGKRVYLLLQLPEEYVGNTKIERYITVVNHHTGLGSVGFGSTNKIYSNTAGGIYANNFFRLYNLGKFRHSSNINERVNVAANQLFQSIREDKEMMETFQKMQNTKLDDPLLAQIMMSCYNVDMNQPLSAMSTRQSNKMEQISAVIKKEVQNQGGSVWGLFNGILMSTQITTPKSTSQTDYFMAGQGYAVNMKAYDTIMDYLNNN